MEEDIAAIKQSASTFDQKNGTECDRRKHQNRSTLCIYYAIKVSLASNAVCSNTFQTSVSVHPADTSLINRSRHSIIHHGYDFQRAFNPPRLEM